jgi:hypothetical protein
MALTKVRNKMISGGIVYADDFGAVGDGVTDDLVAIQAAVNYAESIGGGQVFLDPAKTYAVSAAINLGLTGSPVYLNGEAKYGAKIKALSGFVGGLIKITQGGCYNLTGIGFDKDIGGHSFIQWGSAAQPNPVIEIINVFNAGGFWDFMKTVWEWDNGIIDLVTSNVAVGHSVLDLRTDLTLTGVAYAANPRITRLNLRNPDATPVVGSNNVTGIYLDGVEGLVLSGLISNFSVCVQVGDFTREVNVENLLALDLRSTPTNNLWEDAWTATTAISLNKYIKPTVANTNGYFYICTAAGTTGATEPTWPTTIGATVTDGSAIWTTVNTSIIFSVGNCSNMSVRNCRFEDGIVAFRNTGNGNTSIDSTRLVGQTMAYFHTSTNNAELFAVNSLFAGDVQLVRTGGGPQTRFGGANNLIISDTLGQVPSHEFAGYSWFHTYKSISDGNAINNSIFVDIADGKLKFRDSTGTINLLY